jgi:hypothetical protein
MDTSSVASPAWPNDIRGVLVSDCLAGTTALYAPARLLRAPGDRFSCGRLGKAPWSLASLWLNWCGANGIIPAAATRQAQSLARRQDTDPPREVRFVTGNRARLEGHR